MRQGDDVYWLGKGVLKPRVARKIRGARGEAGRATSLAGGTTARSTSCPQSRPHSRVATGLTAAQVTNTVSCRGMKSARKRARASSTSRLAAAPRTTSWARRSDCLWSRRSTRTVTTCPGFGWLTGLDAHAVARTRRRGSRAEGQLLPPGGVLASVPALLALRHAAPLSSRG